MSLANPPPQGRVEEFLELLRPGRLASMDVRKLLLYTSQFQKIEAEIRKIRIEGGSRPLRIAMLATLSSQHFISILTLFLYSDGIVPEFLASEFDGILTDGNDPNAKIWKSLPDALVVFPALDDIKSWPRMFANEEEISNWVKCCAQRYLDIWQNSTNSNPNCHIYHMLFAPPIERPLGNLERRYSFSKTNCLKTLNTFLSENAPANVTIIDLEALSDWAGSRQWHDEVAYFTSKQPLAIREMPQVTAQLSRLIAAAHGMVRKCLVLDLDNTLWGGVIGDDGVDGIQIDPSDPRGEAFLAFQRYILELKSRGVILAVCSKNDAEIARTAFEQHPDIVLRMDDFAVFVANWDDKATNLQLIAKQLNIGIDSLVFFDDNPAERALVREFAPEVFVIEVPEDPALFIRTLDQSYAFEWMELTAEDLGRADSYIHERKRHELEKTAGDYEDYLRSLEMLISIEITDTSALTRATQLTNKTNQFNPRTKRYSEEDMSRFVSSHDHDVLHVRLRDRFTNYGIIASVVIRYFENIAFIENWVMSCRVFKRGVEDATFNAILEMAEARNAEWLAAEYSETSKNGYVSDLFDRLGLSLWQQDHTAPKPPIAIYQGRLYIQRLSDLSPKHHVIRFATIAEPLDHTP